MNRRLRMVRGLAAWATLNPLVNASTLAAEPQTHKTAHFDIGHDTSIAEAETLGASLENAYAAVRQWCHELGIVVHPPPDRLNVVFFDRFEDFVERLPQYAPQGQGTVGLYVADENKSLFCRLDRLPIVEALDRALANRSPGPVTDQLRSRRTSLVARLRQVVYSHEAAHQVLFNVGVLDRQREYPFWLVEGLACQLETARNTADLRGNALRLADLHTTDISVTTLLALVAEPPIDDSSNPPSPFHYALANLLVDFLRHERTAAFVEHLQKRHRNPLADFETSFGPIDGALVSAMRKRYESR